MNITPSSYTISDYCEAMKRKKLIVNREYQRSGKVWPPPARSFLIETILLGYPIPKLSLYQITDVKSKETYKEIVDGQQRSRAILDFYDDKLKISSFSEMSDVASKTFSQMDAKYKKQFMEYPLSVDIYVATTPDEIREVFRRINSYTVPLNPEEKRHSLFQGDFKWFIYHMSKRYDQILLNLGVFKERQLVRMADAKLYSEICHAFLFGISTTNAKKLDDLYKSYEEEFQKKLKIENRIKEAINFIMDIEDIHNGPLMKPYNFYALVLAVSHKKNEIDNLSEVYQSTNQFHFERDIGIANLTSLADSLENPEAESKFSEFINANISKTNVAEQRKIRFKWFCKALEPNLI